LVWNKVGTQGGGRSAGGKTRVDKAESGSIGLAGDKPGSTVTDNAKTDNTKTLSERSV
jgi:hypothetical protein